MLLQWGRGNDDALERLIPLVYQELHRIARRCMAGERVGHSLQATALVNEAFVRLVDGKAVVSCNLDVAKIEAGRMELDTETIAVDVLVRDTMAMLESTANAKGIVLRAQVPKVVAPIVTDAVLVVLQLSLPLHCAAAGMAPRALERALRRLFFMSCSSSRIRLRTDCNSISTASSPSSVRTTTRTGL